MAPLDLQSDEHRDLLDIIDKLRLQGLSRYVDLPEIVVCGDQSAGKSSVLEAISRMSFPTKDNLCTRFATELVLRRDSLISAKVSIVPATNRSPEERKRLSELQVKIDGDRLDLTAAVDAAKEAMGLSDIKIFSQDTLRVELSGPNQPHLTLVDLPGIFRAGSQDQSVSDAETVRDMVRGYMSSPRSIILAVVSAKSDFALQEITELAKELDPNGSRTLGLITKPDTLDAGSDSEVFFAKLARNTNVVLRLGWHVLMNRSYKLKDAPSDERDRIEAGFLESGVWAALDGRLKGVKMLMVRLSKVLKEQILQQLPSLLHDVEEGIRTCHLDKKRLGMPRNNLEDHRRYLLQVSQDFSTLMKSATDGVYTDCFFGNAKSEEGYHKRLRALIQNSLSDFANEMRLYGEDRVISDSTLSSTQEQHGATRISWSDYVDEVKVLMRRSRGRELPGTFSPLLIGELFTEQSRPWESIVTATKQVVVDAVYRTVKHILSYVATDDAGKGIFRIISGRIAVHTDELDSKVAELLRPHQSSHPITYNHYLTDNVQKAQSTRRAKHFESTFKEALGVPNIKEDSRYKMFPLQLLNRLQQRTQVDMERYASELAADYMQAYYKVALKKFVDDFSILAVEQCLVRNLALLFDAQMVYSINENDLLALTAESEETVDERARCFEKLTALEAGLRELRRLDLHQPLEVHTQDTDRQRKDPDLATVGEASNLLANTQWADSPMPGMSATHAKEEPIALEDDGMSDAEVAKPNDPTNLTPADAAFDDWAAFSGATSKATRKHKR